MAGTTTTGKTTLWEVDCSTECGFMVREHNQKSLINAVQGHLKNVHNTTKTDKDVLAMARKV